MTGQRIATGRKIKWSLLLLLALCLQTSQRSIRASAPLRIGTNQSFTFNFIDKNGQPAGFAVEVLQRAAQIRGYQLEWIATEQSPIDALNNGTADFWPYVTITPARERLVHFARPFWRSPTALYFPLHRNIGKVEDLANKTVAFGLPSMSKLERLKIPASTRKLETNTTESALLLMCRGEADAAWVDPRYVEAFLLVAPEVCRKLDLGTLHVPNSTRIYSLASNFAHSRQADELRDAIDILAENGELVAMALRWKLIQETDSVLFDWISRRTQETQMQRIVLICLAVLFIVSLVFLRNLMKARAEAERSAAARSSFLATMSHEIRTPMNGILGLTELALQGHIPARERSYLIMARDSARSLLQILNDILDFSRVESGKIELESIPFSLREVAQRSIQIFQLSAQAKGLLLETKIDPALPDYVQGDPGRIQQVLINLLGNGVKFTAKGSITLSLQAAHSSDGESSIVFAVADTGIGISPDQQAGIFEAFTQADASTTRRFGGTGLGLSISYRLVKQMGGQIELQSTPGEGSRFFFTLALPVAKAPTPLPQMESVADTRQLDVLVVEDNAVNRLLLERILQRAGHKVRMAFHGQEALDILQSESFDAILMDLQMPVMDGLEATRQIRLREQTSSERAGTERAGSERASSGNGGGRHTPIVALTANAMAGDAEICLKAGMDAYLTKPVEAKTLLALLANLPALQPSRPTQTILR